MTGMPKCQSSNVGQLNVAVIRAIVRAQVHCEEERRWCVGRIRNEQIPCHIQPRNQQDRLSYVACDGCQRAGWRYYYAAAIICGRGATESVVVTHHVGKLNASLPHNQNNMRESLSVHLTVFQTGAILKRLSPIFLAFSGEGLF